MKLSIKWISKTQATELKKCTYLNCPLFCNLPTFSVFNAESLLFLGILNGPQTSSTSKHMLSEFAKNYPAKPQFQVTPQAHKRAFLEAFRGKSPLKLKVLASPFQKRVWQALLTVPSGELWSYQTLACSIGLVKGARAVGKAVGQNPISGIIPCHRIVHQRGTKGAYRWGLQAKKCLQNWEKPTKILTA